MDVVAGAAAHLGVGVDPGEEVALLDRSVVAAIAEGGDVVGVLGEARDRAVLTIDHVGAGRSVAALTASLIFRPLRRLENVLGVPEACPRVHGHRMAARLGARLVAGILRILDRDLLA
jgi:hypothetical protein